MIKFNMVRSKNKTAYSQVQKLQKTLAKQITEGINSSPYKEMHTLEMKIYDRPVSRFLFKFFEVGEESIPLKVKAVFTRAGYEKGKLGAKKYDFTDNFSLSQLNELREGKDLVHKKGSFLNRLVNTINKAVEE